MTHTKVLLVSGLENHLFLRECMEELQGVGLSIVQGNESLTLTAGLASAGKGVLSLAGWVGGKTYDGLAATFNGAGKQLAKAFDDNKSLIKRVMGSNEHDGTHDYKLTDKQVAAITSEGDLSTFEHDLDTLLAHLKELEKHGKDVLDYLDKQLICVRSLKSVQHTDGLFKVIDEFAKIEYPDFKLSEHDKQLVKSKTLPGAKEWTFQHPDHGKTAYSMLGNHSPAKAGVLSMSKSEVNQCLSKLEKVNDLHQAMKTLYDRYLTFLKSWADTAKVTDEALTKLEYRVTKSALNEAEKLLNGNSVALSFYSGFIPRVVSYTDRYIHGVLGTFA